MSYEYSSSCLDSKTADYKMRNDRNLMFMTNDQRLKYWKVKPLETKRKSKSKKANPKAKILDEKQVREIRRLCAEGKLFMREIGEKFGVSRGTVSSIKSGRLWKHLE